MRGVYIVTSIAVTAGDEAESDGRNKINVQTRNLKHRLRVLDVSLSLGGYITFLTVYMCDVKVI